MKRLLPLLCLVVLVALLPVSPAGAQLQPGDLVAICGDSITEQKLYSLFIEDYLLMCQPKPDLRAMQFGWGGEQASGFDHRMIKDVLRYKPTVATTCYGMNDGGYGPLTDERANRYREFTTAIVKKFKDGGVRFILVGSPGCVDSDTFRRDPKQAEVYNKTLSQLRDIARDVAKEQGVAFADVNSAMNDAMAKAKAKYGHDYHVAGGDGVHPARNGHLVMAYAFLKALGCDGEIGTITVDLAGEKAEATPGHMIVSASGGAVEVESSRYPFCFSGDAASPDGTRGIVEFIPFNQELNRLQLVVNNSGADRLKVTWGQASKEFSADQLAKGINLAAEFPDNPFSDAFKKGEDAIRKQQEFETPMIKQVAHVTDLLPEEAETVEKLMTAAKKHEDQLFADSRAAITPVRHHIVIEAVK